ncbi:MAG TPA: hypothetical protein ENH41_02625 [Candidatus Omnitrophica bacterium]|nr:hypothetical protein [Candidatus Omnitrophota bacterium]
MPYPNQHSARVAEPIPQGRATYAAKSIAPGITLIMQKPKAGGNMTAQSYRFGKHQFSVEQAKAWLKKHNIKYISFEPATSGK